MRLAVLGALAASSILCAPASAAALRVSPILLEGGAGGDTALTLRNLEPRPMTVQVRVFRWTLRDGSDDLEPTDDVVASPPIVTVAPSEDYQVRLRRLVPGEPRGEESFRVVVDEVPNPDRQRNGTVAVVLRYVVPAFFTAADAAQPRLAWTFGVRDGRPVLRAANAGDRRIRVDDLGVRSGRGVTTVRKGLAGYVLGRSEREWPLPPTLRPSTGDMVVGRSDRGTLDAAIRP